MIKKKKKEAITAPPFLLIIVAHHNESSFSCRKSANAIDLAVSVVAWADIRLHLTTLEVCMNGLHFLPLPAQSHFSFRSRFYRNESLVPFSFDGR